MNFKNKMLGHPIFEELREKFEAVSKLLQKIATMPRYTTIEIVHDDDADGWASGALLQSLLISLGLGAHIKRTAKLHGEAFKKYICGNSFSEDTKAVFILDHSLEPWLATFIASQHHVRTFVMVDHHVTDQELVEPNIQIVDKQFSTTALTYMFVLWSGIESEIGLTNHRLIEAIDHNDRWLYGKNPDLDQRARNIAAYCDDLGCENVDWNFLTCCDDEDLDRVVMQGVGVRAVKQREIEKLVKNQVRFVEKGFGNETHRVAMIFHSGRAAEVGEALLAAYGDRIDFAMIVATVSDERKYKLSFRSSDAHADVQKIAKLFGGGGHRNAAGAFVSHQVMANMLDPFRCNFSRSQPEVETI